MFVCKYYSPFTIYDYYPFYQICLNHLLVYFGVLSNTSFHCILWAHLAYPICNLWVEQCMYFSTPPIIRYSQLPVHFGVLSNTAFHCVYNTMTMNLKNDWNQVNGLIFLSDLSI